MRARFWVFYKGSPVRITLHEGKGLSWSFAHPTEEGYHEEGETYFLSGDTLTREWWEDGQDCDGRLTREGETWCRVDALDAGNEVDGVRWPLWRTTYGRQRDYAAEAMGY